MGFKLNVKINSIIRVLMILLFCSFTIFETYFWGKYVMLGCIALIFLFDIMRYGFKYRFVFGRYILTIMLFAFYAMASAIWAENSSDAVTMGTTLFEIVIMTMVLYNCYHRNENGVSDLFLIIKWSSFIIVIYSILFYGIDNLILMGIAEARIENTYTNVNTIGMLAAIGTLIQVNEIINEKKFKLAGIFCIPSIFMLAITQSRKALVVLLVGTIMILILRNIDFKNFPKMMVKVLFSLIIGGIIIYVIISLPIFSGVMERMDGLLANFTGTGEVDHSTKLRSDMITIGLEQFIKTPILGMGIGNPHYLAAKQLGRDAYLHNNFIELLAGGGIIGFLIYYSMYTYLFMNFWKYRKYKNREYIICLTIMLLLFAMDFGMVSYYNKSRYIYLMIYFLEVEKIKKIARQSTLRMVYK